MKYLLLYKLFLIEARQQEHGFSLIETVIALVTLAVCLAYAMPLFLYAKINNAKSEIRTGALIVAQRTFDNIRSQSIIGMPINDGQYNTTSDNPKIIPTQSVLDDDPTLSKTTNAALKESLKLTNFAMGRLYQTKVTYCAGITGKAATSSTATDAVAADPTVCTDKYRKFKVEVNYNGSKVYDLEGTYTEFQ